MSDLSANQGEVALDGPDPTTVGALEDSVVRLDPSTPESSEVEGEHDEGPAVWDWTAHADELVTIKVDGEDVQVPVKELTAGYSRQSDYTKKAQALAEERSRVAAAAALKEALDVDPRKTIAALQAMYGDDPYAAEEPDDPTMAAIKQLEGRLAAQEQERQREIINTQAREAVAAQGLKVSADELLQFATDNRIGDLTVAAKFLAATDPNAKAAATTQAVVEKKRAAQVIEGGTGRAPNSTQAPEIKTLADAFRAAKKTHGLG